MMCADAMWCVPMCQEAACNDNFSGVSSPENVKRGEMRKRGPTARPQVSALSHQGRDLLVPRYRTGSIQCMYKKGTQISET